MPSIEKPEALLFDLDDTIIAWDAVTAPSWMKICGMYAPRLDSLAPDTLYRAVMRAGEAYWGDPENHRKGRASLAAIHEARKTVVSNALTELGVADLSPAREIALAYDTERTQAAYLLPGALDTLVRIKARGYPTGLVTNGGADMQREKVERFGLEKYFDVIAIEGEIGFGKPDPAHFSHVLEKLEVSPESVWMTGDDLSRDIAGANAAGIHAVWVDWKGSGLPENAPASPDRIVRAIAELAGLL